jgi:hypothetical protein
VRILPVLSWNGNLTGTLFSGIEPNFVRTWTGCRKEFAMLDTFTTGFSHLICVLHSLSLVHWRFDEQHCVYAHITRSAIVHYVWRVRLEIIFSRFANT